MRVIRAAFDIGSGSTKMQVSEVEIIDEDEASSDIGTDKATIVSVLYGLERPVPFGFAFQRSTDGTVSESVMEAGLQVLRELKAVAQSMHAGEYSAVATEVFRKASNGSVYLDRVVNELGIPVRMVSQDKEASLGFNSAVVMCPPSIGLDSQDAVVYDSGGASMQITKRMEDKSYQSYMAALGTSVSNAILVTEILRASLDQTSTVNPVAHEHAEELIRLLIDRLDEHVPSWLKDRSIVIAAAGANSIFKVCCDVLGGGRTSFVLEDARRALSLSVAKTDDEIAGFVSFPNSEGWFFPSLLSPMIVVDPFRTFTPRPCRFCGCGWL
jgi:exopolyphosphatase / guanosine-5'-triphosphate,3'-diphosphate pyrophosphatase